MFERSYANLYYLFSDLFGIELGFLRLFQSFGFFMALAFLAAAFFLYMDLKRKEKLGLIKGYITEIEVGRAATPTELFVNGLLGFVIGFKLFYLIGNMDEVAPNPQEWLMSAKGNILGGIIGAAILAGQRRYEKNKQKLPTPKKVKIEILPHQQIGDIVMVAAIGGILGAKLFYLIEDEGNITEFLSDPLGSFFGGLTIYGGLIGGAALGIWYARKRGLHVWHTLDSVAPTLLVAYAVGRMGCQVSGDGDWGLTNTNHKPGWLSWLPDRWWAFDYAHNVNNVGKEIAGCTETYCHVLEQPAYPTPLYEITMALIFFTILWSLRKRIVVPGAMLSIYLILNGIARFTIEQIRVTDKLNFFGMQVKQAEIIAVCFILAGITGLVYFTRKYKGDLVTK